jgi:hypothetical protein
MKLFLTSIKSHYARPESLAIDGRVEDIVKFINSVRDGRGIARFDESDLEGNGGNWGCPPDRWTPDAPFYFDTPTERKGGFKTLKTALVALITNCGDYILVE